MTRRLSTVTIGLAAAMMLATLPAVTGATAAEPGADDGPVVVGGGTGQVYLYGADPETPATLLDPEGDPVASDELEWSVGGRDYAPGGDTTDANGALVFRGTLDEDLLEFSGIEPGEGYTVEYVSDGETEESDPVTVLHPEQHPDQAFYEAQEILPGDLAEEDGLTFLETRDGVQLSVLVELPGDPEDGPYPTLVEYSGYDVSAPPAEGDLPVNIGAPTLAIGQLMGYATVAVNMRGTGCSGGAFDYFETQQALDGYDAVEAIAAQDWSANVGTVGVSYPGISQLFLASTQPPSLAAAAPKAVISDHARDTVMPGGIFNTGFAREWAEERELDTRFPDGQSWVDDMVGSEHPAAERCGENVLLRDQNLPLLDRIESNEHASELWDSRAPWEFAEEIDTNLFLVNSWQDEQTGGRSAAILDALDLERDDRTVRFVGTNGTHIETLGPEVLTDLIEFLELYVGERAPSTDFLSAPLAALLYTEILGVDIEGEDVTIPEDRFTGQSHAEALAAYEAEPPARILFETGAGEGPDGFPYPSFSHRFAWEELPDIAARRGEFDVEASTYELEAGGVLRGPEPEPAETCLGAPDSGFDDATGPHGSAIDCLRWYGLTEGETETTFGTQNDVRRDQTASFVASQIELVDGLELPEGQPGAFPDVGDGPHLAAVELLAGFEPRIVDGFEDGAFRPADDVRRGQIASIVVRALDEIAPQHDGVEPLPAGGIDQFEDVANSPHEEAIGRLTEAGIIEGYGDGRFGTQDSATRGQIATILAGVLEGLVADGAIAALATPAELDAAGTGVSSYVYDPDQYPPYSFLERPSNAGIWPLQPAYGWQQPPSEASLSFTTAPFTDDQVMVGSASVDLWLDSDQADSDVEVVISELRPDGTEMYVTTGWLRASKRALDPETSTALRPRPTYVEADEADLSEEGFDQVRVETFPFGHAFRAGSRLRLSIEAPGGNRPLWRFDEAVPGGPDVHNRVAHDEDHASRLVLPIVTEDLGELPELPVCTSSEDGDGMTSVRAQPCRTAAESPH